SSINKHMQKWERKGLLYMCVCPFSSHRSIANKHHDANSLIVCPISFPSENKVPAHKDAVKFELRISPNVSGNKPGSPSLSATVFERSHSYKGQPLADYGVVMLNKDRFVGWIKNEDLHVLREKIFRGNKLKGEIDSNHVFHWPTRGGHCVSGQASFVDRSCSSDEDEH